MDAVSIKVRVTPDVVHLVLCVPVLARRHLLVAWHSVLVLERPRLVDSVPCSAARITPIRGVAAAHLWVPNDAQVTLFFLT